MIVEDEPHILNYMKRKIAPIKDLELIGSFLSPTEVLRAFEQGEQPDLVFLDVEMPEMTGIELAHQLLNQQQNLIIIFTTAHRHSILDDFKNKRVSCLLKPIVTKDIQRCLDAFKE